MKRGRKVQITGFGTFATVRRKARMERNPKTAEAIKVPATTVAKFSAWATLKALVNKKSKRSAGVALTSGRVARAPRAT